MYLAATAADIPDSIYVTGAQQLPESLKRRLERSGASLMPVPVQSAVLPPVVLPPIPDSIYVTGAQQLPSYAQQYAQGFDLQAMLPWIAGGAALLFLMRR